MPTSCHPRPHRRIATVLTALLMPILVAVGVLSPERAAAAPTEMTALVVVAASARKDFVSDKALGTYIESQFRGLNTTLRTYTDSTIRVVGTMVVPTDPNMIKNPAVIDGRIRDRSKNYAGVLPKRDQLKADLVFVFAGKGDYGDAASCSWAISPAWEAFFYSKPVTLEAMKPVADRAIVILLTKPTCKNLNGIHRGFGRMMGLLWSKSEYSSRFFKAVPDKTVFSFVLDPKSPIAEAVTDAMAFEACLGTCGLAYYSGKNVSVKVGPLGQVVFYKDVEGGLHDGTGWLKRMAPVAAAFR